MSWQKSAKKLAAGRWVRFDADSPSVELTFLGEPQEVEKTASMGDRKGEKYKVMSFPVLVDGDEKILEPNNSLLNALLDEDGEEEIIGGTFLIKCLNLKSKREWKIRRMKSDEEGIESWKGQKEQEPTPNDEKKMIINEEEEEKKKKAKFMKDVEEKKKAKKQKKEEKEGEDNAEAKHKDDAAESTEES